MGFVQYKLKCNRYLLPCFAKFKAALLYSSLPTGFCVTFVANQFRAPS